MNIKVEGIGTVRTASILDGLNRAELEKNLLAEDPQKWVEQGILGKDEFVLDEENKPIYPSNFRIMIQLYVNLCSCTIFSNEKPEFRDLFDAEKFPEIVVVPWYEAAKKVNGHWWGEEPGNIDEKKSTAMP